MITLVKIVWKWLRTKLIFPIAFFLLGGLILSRYKKKPTETLPPKDVAIRDAVISVEVGAATEKATAGTEAREAIEDLKEASTDPNGEARRKKMAERLGRL